MPSENSHEVDSRFLRLEDQHKQIENRIQHMDSRHSEFEKAIIDISKSLGKFEAIADDIKDLRLKIYRIDSLEDRLKLLEGKKAVWNDRFFRVGFYILSSIVMYYLYKYGIPTTINNSSG